MAELKLSLENLGELDGGSAELVINNALRLAVHDLDDRGKDGKPREVNIKVIMTQMDNGIPIVRVDCGVKVPAFRTAETIGILRRVGDESTVRFQSLAPGEPTQRTIDERISEIRKHAEPEEN